MELFPKKFGPVFLKETSDTAEFVTKMKVLCDKVSPELKNEIQKKLRWLSMEKLVKRILHTN